MHYPVEVTGHIPTMIQMGARAVDRALGVVKALSPAFAAGEATLAGLRVGFIGDAASPALIDLVRSMGASAETADLDGRRLPAERRPDAVIVSWPSTTGDETAEWQQVARMRLDNPRMVVILLDWSKGSLFTPCHDLRISRGASRARIRETLSELRVLRRMQALSDLRQYNAAVSPLFRSKPVAPVGSAPSIPCAEAA